MRNISSTAFAMTLLLATPAIAKPDLFFWQGGCASASFFSTDSTGCITTEIVVSACDSRESEGAGGYEPEPWLGMSLSRLDWCNSVELIQAGGSSPDGIIKMSNSLKSATARGSVELYDDIQGISFEAEIDLTWNGIGPISGRREHNYYSGNVQDALKENSRSRAAVATGTIFVEGIPLAKSSQSGSLSYGRGLQMWWHGK